FGDAGVAFAVPILRARGEGDHCAALLHHDHGMPSVEPLANVVPRARARFEGRHAILDPLVVDAGDGVGVGGNGRAGGHRGGYDSRIMKLIAALLLAIGLNGAEPPEVANLLAEIIRIDTSNPPGNESRLAEFLKTKFAPLGFEIDIVPGPQAGRSSFIARLRGDGSKRPVLIAAHEDVVGVEREQWSVDPFAGIIR